MPASTVRSGSGQLESTLSSRDAPVQSIDTLGELGVLSFPRLQKESHSHSNATATLQRQVLRPPGSSAEDWAADWAWWQILRPPFPPPPCPLSLLSALDSSCRWHVPIRWGEASLRLAASSCCKKCEVPTAATRNLHESPPPPARCPISLRLCYSIGSDHRCDVTWEYSGHALA